MCWKTFITPPSVYLTHPQVASYQITVKIAGKLRAHQALTSKYTCGIYLSHTVFVIIFPKVLQISGNPWGYWIELPNLFVGVQLSSLVVLKIAGKLKIRWTGRLFYGSVPKQNQLSGEFL